MAKKPDNGYRGSFNLKRTHTQINWTPELLQEFQKCAADPLYFAENYMKVVHVDRGLETIELYPYQRDIINSVHNKRATVVECARQAGKALTLNTKIPTPTGWSTMGELKRGDKLFDENGSVTTVKSISKIFYNHDCYRITFDDGSTVDADAEHLWCVEKANKSKREIRHKKLTTQQLFDSNFVKTDSRGKVVSKWKIPLTKPVQYQHQQIDINPYTLGLWLGDGESASGRITCDVSDLPTYRENVPYEFSHNHNNDSKPNLYSGTIYGLYTALRKYNLLKNKHIPSEFLFNTIENRQELLRGLMDSDGWSERGRNCICFTNNRNQQLIENTYTLLVGLGLKVFRKFVKETNSTRLYFQCPIDNFAVFKLQRKLDKQHKSLQRISYTNYRFIRNIEKIESVPTKCIEVSNDSHLFLCSEHFIPTHNTTSLTAIILHYVIFNEYKNVAILANKESTSKEILARIKLAYEHLPSWLQHGIVEWNKGNIELENGCKIMACATSSDNIRGFAVNLLFIDEAAWIDGWDAFFTSVYPTISSGKTTKLVLVSTVNGLNHFHQITSLARKRKNDYNLISVTWKDVPGRDAAWKKKTLQDLNFDYEKFAQEYENEYLGSSGTLIQGSKLKQLTELVDEPIVSRAGIKQYHPYEKGHEYIITADVSRGKGLDHSAFQIIDVSKLPYVQVCTFRDNTTTPVEFAEIIHRFAKMYGDAHVLVEINDIGQQVSDLLYYDYECDNLLFTDNRGAKGKVITTGMKPSTDKGLRTTKTTKNQGCSILKLLVEQDQLIIRDHETIYELSTFSQKGNSYQAEPGKHDDLAMCLVIFSWLTEQGYFKSLTDINTLLSIRDKSAEDMEEDMVPFGFVDYGTPDESRPIDLDLHLNTDERWMLVD